MALYAPLWIAAVYLGGTYLLFLALGHAAQAPRLALLSAYIAATVVALIAGYVAKIRRCERRRAVERVRTDNTHLRASLSASAGYFIVYGIALLQQYGATGPGSVLRSLTNPGAAYYAKFNVYAEQQALGTVSLPLQVLTLVSGLYPIMVPYAVVYWRDISRGLRLLVIGGVLSYASFFIYIGTMKGLGDLLIFGIAGLAVRRFGHERRGNAGRTGGALPYILISVCLASAVGYMAYSQGQRIAIVGVADRYPPNPIVASVVGDGLARGVTTAVAYPTDGYLGLAYNLETPFKWTHGLGSARAIDGYWAQYFGHGKSVLEDTYPGRTQVLTGWPALQSWATIYPWLASDLTFVGAVGFMFIVGWMLASFWHAATYRNELLGLALFAEVALLIAYVPANNQIGGSRPGVLGFVTLVFLYAWTHSITSLRKRHSVDVTGPRRLVD